MIIQNAWWRHQMETFSALLAICAGNSPVPGEFPAQRPVTRSFDVFFDLLWINGSVNNREAGDLRRYRTHCDVTVMYTSEMENFYYHYIVANPGPVFKNIPCVVKASHQSDVIMSAVASQITRVLTDYSTVCSGADQRKHQSSPLLAFLRGIHRWPVNSPHTKD